MTNPQGTQWESQIVKDASRGMKAAGRYPKRAQKGEPDVWIGFPESQDAIPIVVWKRLVGRKADGRRRPDGEPAVVVIGYNDFLDLLRYIPREFEVQAKWTANLNVTKTLGELRAWIKEHR